MTSYPDFIQNFLEEISDSLNYDMTFNINVTNEAFDKNHDFRMLVNSFTNFFDAKLVESCNGDYFIISNGDYYILLVTIIEFEDEMFIYASLFRNIDDVKKSDWFKYLENHDGNFEKFYKFKS